MNWQATHYNYRAERDKCVGCDDTLSSMNDPRIVIGDINSTDPLTIICSSCIRRMHFEISELERH